MWGDTESFTGSADGGRETIWTTHHVPLSKDYGVKEDREVVYGGEPETCSRVLRGTEPRTKMTA